VKVTGANLEHGMLSIELAREVPEQLKPRRIEVQSAAAKLPDSRPKLVEQETKAA
jgi:molecular chaperone IbpA